MSKEKRYKNQVNYKNCTSLRYTRHPRFQIRISLDANHLLYFPDFMPLYFSSELEASTTSNKNGAADADIYNQQEERLSEVGIDFSPNL